MRLPGKKPLAYLITNGATTSRNYRENSGRVLDLIRAAVRCEIALVQIREKQLPARRVFELARQAAEITKKSPTLLLVNDRADIAAAAGADGVHLTENSLPARVVKQTFGTDFVVGCSAHSIETVLNAKTAGADFATFSPVFATASKVRFGEPQGLEKLLEACRAAADFPIFALGGIDQTNYRSALAADAAGIAAIRLFGNPETLPDIINRIKND